MNLTTTMAALEAAGAEQARKTYTRRGVRSPSSTATKVARHSGPKKVKNKASAKKAE